MPNRASIDVALPPALSDPAWLADFGQDIFAVLAKDGTFQFVSSAVSRVLGYSPDGLSGRGIETLLRPEDGPQARRDIERFAAKPGIPISAICRLRSKEGSWRLFEISGRSYASEGGEVVLACVFRDVTDLRRMRAERRVISDVIHALNQTSNLDELLEQIHQALKKVVYAENCFVALHEPATAMFHFPFFVDRFDSAPAPLKVGRSCTAYVFRTGRAMMITQRAFDALAAQGEVELVGSPSPTWLGVPLKTPTATIGVLVLQHYEDENAYNERDVEFMDSVGGTIALAIERRRAEDALRKSESMFRLLFAHNPLPTWVFDTETLRFIEVNQAAVNQYGFSEEEFRSMTVLDIRSDGDAGKLKEQQDFPAERYSGRWKHRKKNGQIIEVEIVAHNLEYGGRRVCLVVAQDVTEREMLDQQLRQAQKMEAVGRLAGGIAHDFNNLLMVIKGHTEMLLSSHAASPQTCRKIEQIDRSADRAASLTRQLLAFSRMQVLQPTVLDLGEVVEDMGKLLPSMIGEDVELSIHTQTDLGKIRADSGQIEQIIMNLAVNARDAMPEGGRLIIETANTDLDANYSAKRPVTKPGAYVMLAVTDTGQGMDEATQAHIFEPFFTTKEKGKGTGLGLATVYGVVKQSGGFIWVYSEVGRGTTFKIYFPRVDQAADSCGTGYTAGEAPRGTETILLTEDEHDVREVAREYLQSGGYTVIEARDGLEALRLAEEHQGTIDLLITDMVMPGMTGVELASRLKKTRGMTSVVFMSGYSAPGTSQIPDSDKSSRLLTKPFSRLLLLRTIRELLASDGQNGISAT
ncbi:MAG TPA: PAS domain S-box protein [Methylomirabilota bacterium]|nr:PAS domain S-box protein [Methylomirabilota bacterium]